MRRLPWRRKDVLPRTPISSPTWTPRTTGVLRPLYSTVGRWFRDGEGRGGEGSDWKGRDREGRDGEGRTGEGPESVTETPFY